MYLSPSPPLVGFSSSVVGVTMRSMLVLSVLRLTLVEWRRTRDSTPPTPCYTPIAMSEWGRRDWVQCTTGYLEALNY